MTKYLKIVGILFALGFTLIIGAVIFSVNTSGRPVVQAFSTIENSGKISSNLAFPRAVKACLVSAYEPCNGDLCYEFVPEGTIGLVVRENVSQKQTVFLFLTTYEEFNPFRIRLRYLLSSRFDMCVEREPFEPIYFGVEEKSIENAEYYFGLE